MTKSNSNSLQNDILIFDQDPLYLKKLKRELFKLDVEIDTCLEKEKLLDLCSKHQFRLIVLEINNTPAWNQFITQVAESQKQARFVINFEHCPAKARIEKLVGRVYNCLNKDDSLSVAATLIKDAIKDKNTPLPQAYVEMVQKNQKLLAKLQKNKENPEQIRNEVKKWYKLVDGHGDGFFEFNMKTKDMYISSETKKVLGYNEDEFESTRSNWLAHLHPDDLDWALNYMKVFEESNEQFIEFKFRIRHKDGHYIWMRVRGKKLYDQNNNPVKLIGVHTDITKQEEEENKNRQLEKLKILSDFSGKISHELNNYLSGIMGYADLLQEYIDNNIKEHQEAHEYLTEIKKAIKKSSNITNNLVSFAAKAQSYSVPVKINNIIEDLCNLIKHSSPKLQIATNFNAGNIEILGDQARIKNALLNILLNAKEAATQKTKIVISTEITYLNQDKMNVFNIERGKFLKISITDNVGGLSEEAKLKIFEPFYTTKKDRGNIGMGMATVFNIVKMHKGCIDIKTVPGKETSISVFLPVQNQFFSTEDDYEIEDTNSQKTILLVDDENFIRKVVKRILSREGYKVITCKDGEEAIQTYTNIYDQIDLILLDLIMPKKDGETTFYEMKEINPQLEVIFISGFIKNHRVENLLEAGGKGFLKKPFGKRELLAAINKHIKPF